METEILQMDNGHSLIFENRVIVDGIYEFEDVFEYDIGVRARNTVDDTTYFLSVTVNFFEDLITIDDYDYGRVLEGQKDNIVLIERVSVHILKQPSFIEFLQKRQEESFYEGDYDLFQERIENMISIIKNSSEHIKMDEDKRRDIEQKRLRDMMGVKAKKRKR